MTRVCNLVWQQEIVPIHWKSGIIILLPKKGDLTECRNCRGISLLSILWKVFATVLLNRMKYVVDQVLRQQQAGFRSGRSVIHRSDRRTTTDYRESVRL